METSASSGRTKWLFHRKSIATIDAIEHVLNVANPYLAYGCVWVVIGNRIAVSGSGYRTLFYRNWHTITGKRDAVSGSGNRTQLTPARCAWLVLQTQDTDTVCKSFFCALKQLTTFGFQLHTRNIFCLVTSMCQVVKIIAESLSQHDEKHILLTLLSVGKG
jgi:hypothetical protein